MTKEQKQQFTLRISQANKSELVIILYDIFVAFADDAMASIDPFEESSFHTSIAKAKDTVSELIESVNPENVLAPNYRSLYGFALRQLTSVDINHNPEILKQLKGMILSLKEAYLSVSKEDHSPAVMGNVQEVYAGLTYGKSTLTENISGSDNRGFLA